MTTAEFRLNQRLVTVKFHRNIILQIPVGNMVAVTFKPNSPFEHGGKLCAVIVFPARVIPNGGLEQCGSGFPCSDEAKAKEVAAAIQEKNQKVPHVVLASAPGFFQIGTVTNVEMWREELVLYKFHVPKIVNGQRGGYSFRTIRHFIDKKPELVSEEMLPTTNWQTAQKMFRQKNEEYKTKAAKENKRDAEANAETQRGPSLLESQFKVLSKAYPETVNFLQGQIPANAETSFAAYQRETLALTGHLVGALEKSDFKKAAIAIQNASRRKHSPLNPVEVELVAGWLFRGYARMTPPQRIAALKNLGLEVPTPDAMRKLCKRLKLPSLRKPGFH